MDSLLESAVAAPPRYATTPQRHVTIDASHHRRRRRREPDPPNLLPSRFFYHAHVEPESSPSLSSTALLSLWVTRPRVSPATSPTSKASTSFLSSSCASHTGSWNSHHRASLWRPQLQSELPSLNHLKFNLSTTLPSTILFLLCLD
ncbi:hypothetical protein DEO72_LG8g2277 [Vigna unguiculata]|uniref:Uncharacterized protein n=1 Tax=Vigna unguiculata TaxID=3917 RepID=A0A4D6MS87_VIGUN|nr:hypothetical protein DEO72_LG8g2277 [Vigna unguiculata]